jgi:hypothetical protein
MELTKEEAKKLLSPDFIPGGGRIDIRKLEFRRTGEEEMWRCCRNTGFDPQSGPFFCGKIAEYVAFVGEEGQGIIGAVAVCERHPPPKELIIG